MGIAAADQLANRGVQADVLEVSTLKPLDEESLVASVRKTRRVLTVEEHSVVGGLGSAVAECLARRCPAPVEFIGVQDCFAESGDYLPLMAKYGISTEAIIERAVGLVGSSKAAP
jgi:transketolase